MKQWRYRKMVLGSILSIIFIIGVASMFIKDSGIEEQMRRIEQIKTVCRKYQHYMDRPSYKHHINVFYSSDQYKLSYCKIGKIASTFWAQFFYILHHDSVSAQNILRTGREKVHLLENSNQQIGTNMSSEEIDYVILSSRNPYSRLYSAYIDRIYIPSTSQSVRQDEKCKSLITFEEFLQNVVENTRNGLYDYHWSPIFFICKPCEINPNVLFKQETFRNDISYVLKHTKIEKAKLDTINKIMEEGSKWSPFALMDDILEYIVPQNIYRALDCQTWPDILSRMWEVLKLQGYISEEARFPVELFKSQKDYENPDIFRRGVLEARQLHPMTKQERTSQRRKALYSAYTDIDPEVIHGIQDVFSVDFEMFGYRNDPPPWKDRREH